jgi:uncharacterized protein
MEKGTAALTRKTACYIGGFTCLGLGFIGMLLPLLPTTIFWIIAAWLFAKSHPEMQKKIYNWPKVGPVVEAYLERSIIAPAAKKTAIVGIVVIGGLSLYLSALPMPYTATIAALFCVVIIYVATRKE